MDRRFPPLGVKAVPSYSCATEKGGGAHQVAHAFDNPNAPLSEGGVLAVVVKSLRGKHDWTRVGTDCPHPLRQAWQGGAPRVPASPPAPHGREEGGGSDPIFLPLVRHRAGVGGARQNPPPPLPFSGSLPPQ